MREFGGISLALNPIFSKPKTDLAIARFPAVTSRSPATESMDAWTFV